MIRVDGKVQSRPAGTENHELPTGLIEIAANEIGVHSEAKELPLPVFGDTEYPEDIRLKYRFLDLRRDRIHGNIMKRGAIIDSLRRRMKEQGFFEFQTPILTASSPEGARDYLVPSRVHPGKFYALPQAPQQFKQLLMMSGFDRYFQIAPCFRDEDARADRSPGEFYQLDIEMSFVTQQDVFDAVEPVLRGVFEEFGGGLPVTPKFPMIAFRNSVRWYGTDKPDLRNPIKMQNVTEHFAGSGFKVFAGMIAADPKVEVWAIPAPKGGSRAFCDRMNSWAQGQGQPGLGYVFWRDGEEGAAGPIAKNIGPERTEAIKAQLGLATGDAAFFVAGVPGESFTNSPAKPAPRPAMNSASSPRTVSISAGSSISPCTNGMRTTRRWISPTTPSLCRRADWKRSKARTRSTFWPINMISFAMALSCPPAPFVTTARCDEEGLRDRGLSRRGTAREVRRHVPRLPVWRTAPRRHRARC